MTTPQSVDVAIAPDSGSSGRVLSALTIVGVLVVILGDTQGLSLVPLIDKMQTDYGISATTVGLAMSISGITSAATVPTLLRLGDRFGMRGILLATLAIGGIGNVVCAIAPRGETILLVGRLILGLSAVTTPIMYAVLRARSKNEAEVNRGSGILVAAAGIGVGFAYLLGGVVTHYNGSSRVVFWVTTALAVVTLVVAYVLVPEIPTRTPVPIDVAGVVLLATGMAGITLYLAEGSTWGWGSGAGLASILGGGALILAFIGWELRAPHPMVNLRVVANRRVLPPMIAAGTLGLLAIYFNLAISAYVQTPKLVGYGLSGTVLVASLYLMPIAGAIIIGGVVTKPVIDRLGFRASTALGAFLVLAAALLLAFAHTQTWEYIVGGAVYGLGYALAYASAYANYLGSARQGESGLVTGVGTLFSYGISSVGPVIFTILLTSKIDILSLKPLIAVPAEHNYEVIYLGAAIVAFLVMALPFITKKGSFTQALAEGAVVTEAE